MGPGFAGGPDTQYMETENHVCRAVDAALVRDIVDLLGLGRDIQNDRNYAKYL